MVLVAVFVTDGRLELDLYEINNASTSTNSTATDKSTIMIIMTRTKPTKLNLTCLSLIHQIILMAKFGLLQAITKTLVASNHNKTNISGTSCGNVTVTVTGVLLVSVSVSVSVSGLFSFSFS